MLKNYRAAKRLRQREIARQYLYSQARENLQNYPQMCCYSFDGIGFDINIDGRCDREALALLLDTVDVAGRGVLDIGANIGNHTAAFAERAGHIYAFEPHPRTFKLLELNVGERANVTLFNVGASDAKGTAQAVSPHLNYGATSISEREATEGESVWTFELAPVDSFGLENIALVKLDVEGHELPALRGTTKLLTRDRPAVAFEQNSEAINNGTSESVEFLKSLGYSRFHSIETRLPWRTPQWLPGPLRKATRIAEAFVLGPADWEARLEPVERLESRPYPMLLARF